jgi:hypothetical protein
MNEDAEKSLKALKEALQSDNPEIRLWASRELSQVGDNPTDVLRRLEALVIKSLPSRRPSSTRIFLDEIADERRALEESENIDPESGDHHPS